MSEGKSLPTTGSERSFSTDGLPPELVAVLRDPSVIVPQDAALWELIAEWADAPSDTASAEIDWEQAWRFAVKKMLDAIAERAALVVELEAAQKKAEEYAGLLGVSRQSHEVLQRKNAQVCEERDAATTALREIDQHLEVPERLLRPGAEAELAEWWKHAASKRREIARGALARIGAE